MSISPPVETPKTSAENYIDGKINAVGAQSESDPEGVLDELNTLADEISKMPEKNDAEKQKKHALKQCVLERSQMHLNILHSKLQENSPNDIDTHLEELEGRLDALKELGIEIRPSFLNRISRKADSFFKSMIESLTPSKDVKKMITSGYNAVKETVLGLFNGMKGISVKHVFMSGITSLFGDWVKDLPFIGTRLASIIEEQKTVQEIAASVQTVLVDANISAGSRIYFNERVTTYELSRLKDFSSPSAPAALAGASAAASAVPAATPSPALSLTTPITAQKPVVEKAASVASAFVTFMRGSSGRVHVKAEWTDKTKGITLAEMLDVYEQQILKKPA